MRREYHFGEKKYCFKLLKINFKLLENIELKQREKKSFVEL
jgi:hypothetical protein